MLPPPPVLAPPDGATDALALADTMGAGGDEGTRVGVTDDELGLGIGGAGLDGGGVGVWQVQVGVGVGGGVWWHVHVGVGVGGVGVGVDVWHVHVGVGVGDEVLSPATPPALTAETLVLT